MRILLAEDSKVLQKTIGGALRRSDYAVDVVDNGEDALWSASSGDYDAVVMDIMMPKRDGLQVLRALRSAGNEVHVILLTARDTLTDRITGLREGADDYLTKPFEIEELLARVEALCRRTYKSKSPVAALGDIRIEYASHQVFRGGTEIELTSREYKVLEYLVRRRNEIVSRPEIESHVYDGATDIMSNAIDSTVSALRKKLTRNNTLPDPIRTRRGAGYSFVSESPGDSGS